MTNLEQSHQVDLRPSQLSSLAAAASAAAVTVLLGAAALNAETAREAGIVIRLS